MKYVIWDWNGTLFDDLDFCLESINLLLQRHGLAPLPDIDAYKRVFRFPIREYYRDLGFQFDKTPYEELACEYMDIIHDPGVQDRCRLQQEALYTLDCLQYLGLLADHPIRVRTGENWKIRCGGWACTAIFIRSWASAIFTASPRPSWHGACARKTSRRRMKCSISGTRCTTRRRRISSAANACFAGGHQYLPPDGTGYTVIERLSEVLDYVGVQTVSPAARTSPAADKENRKYSHLKRERIKSVPVLSWAHGLTVRYAAGRHAPGRNQLSPAARRAAHGGPTPQSAPDRAPRRKGGLPPAGPQDGLQKNRPDRIAVF